MSKLLRMFRLGGGPLGKSKRFGWVVAVAAFGALASGSAHGTTLSFSFTDAVGDGTATGDLTGMTFVFDDATGDYTITLTADAAHPFMGNLRIDVNLFDPDTGTIDVNPALFQSTLNDFDLTTPTTTIELTGTNARLTHWSVGDRVAANQYPFGNPAGGGTEFRTGTFDLPLSNLNCLNGGGDCIGPENASNFTTIVPEPSVGVLLGGGIAGLVLFRRTRLS
jgi:hypothetical protein